MSSAWRTRAAIVLALALAFAIPVVADPGQAEQAPDHESQLRLAVENEAGEEREVNITVEGETTWARNATISAGETWRHDIDVDPGNHQVHVLWQGQTQQASSSMQANTAGCEGTYSLQSVLIPNGIQASGGGCEGRLIAFDQLVDEARAAREVDGEGQGIRVPVPRDASEGEFRLASNVFAPDWANASSFPFRWLPNATFHDAWGGEVEGTEVVAGPPSRAEARSQMLVASYGVAVESENRLRYAGNDTAPISATNAAMLARTTPISSSSEVIWNVQFQPEPNTLSCLLRNDRQGTQLQPGQAADPFCPGVEKMEGEWWTGERNEHRGLPAVDLYHLDDLEEPTAVMKITWAHGIPHPIYLATIEVDPQNGDHQRGVMNLSHAQPNGTPVDALPSHQAQRLTIEKGPQRPLEGPQLADRSRFPFPLAEAVEAARNDPTLTELQAMLEDDAVLAGAQLRTVDRTATGEVRELWWFLSFTTADEGPLVVTCERPMTRSADSQPVAADRCEEQGSAEGEFPQLGPEDLAKRSVTWDVAVDRWSLMDPDNATEPVTLAHYAPRLDEDASVEEHRSWRFGSLEVGRNAGPDTASAESSEVPTTVALNATDGRTRTFRTGVKEVGGLTPTDRQLTTTAPAGPDGGEGLVPDADPLVTATAGIGLLTLLAFAGMALYSRLREDEVLAHDTRSAIRDLVEANPGIHGQAIARQVDANDRTVEHHLDVLIREGVVTVLERGGYNHHFVQGQHTPKEMQALASLQRGKAERVYELVNQDPGVDLSTLAEEADISTPYASKLVDQLVDAGLVDKVREGRRSRLYANALPSS